MMRMITLLLFTVFSEAALAQTPVEQLAKPPAEAKIWTITSAEGTTRHGQVSLWTAADGTHWSRFSMNLRGFVSEFDEQNRFAPDGSLSSLTIRGKVPEGDAAETYQASNASYSFKSPVDSGTGKPRPGRDYVSFGGTFDSNLFIFNDMMKSPDHSIDFLPSGHGKLERLTTAEVSNGTETKNLTCYGVTGFDISPFTIWMDGSQFFGTAGFLNFLPQGWEKAASKLSQAQDAALAKRAPALVASIAHTPTGAVVFQNVKLYDSEARQFRDSMTVVVENGRIAAVESTKQTKFPANAQVIDGTGKTLIPGLWDSHQHYIDDSTGPLLLASGITSIRDPGNRPDELWARKKRIEAGQLLGPRIVPSLLIDGQGPYTAQVGVAVHNLDEGLAAVHRAKDDGYFAIKLYGTIDPAWVKPMANLAHQLGLHVHGHIPRGMRPLDAVHAGYDEITHINFVMMQAMPDEVVQTSNGMNRLTGTAKYASNVDLHSNSMMSYLDELAQRGIAVDPTLVTFEDLFVPERGAFAPADAPYSEMLPPQLARVLLSGAMAPSPDVDRAQMRSSFAKLQELIPELYRRHVSIVAGTDGFGFELIRELELYVAAGLRPEDAVATATIVPARVFHLNDQTGSLAVGKLAELALIDGDPSKSVSDLRNVELVMRDNKLMKASDLRAALGISEPRLRTAKLAKTKIYLSNDRGRNIFQSIQ